MEEIMETTMEDTLKDRVEQLVDYIMKWCLWQFHSRAWDREKQNEGVLTKGCLPRPDSYYVRNLSNWILLQTDAIG